MTSRQSNRNAGSRFGLGVKPACGHTLPARKKGTCIMFASHQNHRSQVNSGSTAARFESLEGRRLMSAVPCFAQPEVAQPAEMDHSVELQVTNPSGPRTDRLPIQKPVTVLDSTGTSGLHLKMGSVS